MRGAQDGQFRIRPTELVLQNADLPLQRFDFTGISNWFRILRDWIFRTFFRSVYPNPEASRIIALSSDFPSFEAGSQSVCGDAKEVRCLPEGHANVSHFRTLFVTFEKVNLEVIGFGVR
jgi:hypothetical protein